MHYMETYNASEGFFAIADDASRDDMLLMLDYGTYYEFRDGDEVVPLEGVQAPTNGSWSSAALRRVSMPLSKSSTAN